MLGKHYGMKMMLATRGSIWSSGQVTKSLCGNRNAIWKIAGRSSEECFDKIGKPHHRLPRLLKKGGSRQKAKQKKAYVCKCLAFALSAVQP